MPLRPIFAVPPPTNDTWSDGRAGFPVTSILAASADPVQFIWGLVEVVPEKEILGTPTLILDRTWVIPETAQWSATHPSGLKFSLCPRFGNSYT